MKIRKSLLLAIVSAGAVASSAQAVTLATADFDTYSYVFAGTNNTGGTSVNTSQYNPSGHFTFGLISFDVSGLSSTGDKYLSLQSGYTDGSPGAPVSTTGSAVINVGVLTEDYSDYLASGDKVAWFNANVLSLPSTSMSFTDSNVSSLNVTTEVNNWISGSADNYGFVFWKTTAGQANIVSSDATSGYSPKLTTEAVPEPGAFAAIAGVLALGVVANRRKRASKAS